MGMTTPDRPTVEPLSADQLEKALPYSDAWETRLIRNLQARDEEIERLREALFEYVICRPRTGPLYCQVCEKAAFDASKIRHAPDCILAVEARGLRSASCQ